jgi:alpha-L-fucosidase
LRNNAEKHPPKKSNTASAAPTTTVSMIRTNNNEENDNDMQQLKLKLAAIDWEQIHLKIQQKKVEDVVSTLTHSITKMGGDIMNICQARQH